MVSPMPPQEEQETRTGNPASSSSKKTLVKRALEPDPRLLEPKIEEEDLPQEVIHITKRKEKKHKKKQKLDEVTVKVKEEETENDKEGQTVTVVLNYLEPAGDEPAQENQTLIDEESGNVIFAPGRVPVGAEPPVNPLKQRPRKPLAPGLVREQPPPPSP